jgi:hypothetical protein
MHQTIAPIQELLRMPAPCPQPWGLACDGTDLWIGSIETNRLYGVRALQGTLFEETEAPGRPMGLTVTGDALRVVMSEGDDGDRYIRRYVMGKDFKSERIACPDLTGSFLAYDGDRVFLSQRYLQRILELDEAGSIQRAIAVPRQITGMVIVGGRFYAITTVDRESTDYRLLCIDARKDEPEIQELATIPFIARSLGFDGSKFWTAVPDSNEIVAFAKPD